MKTSERRTAAQEILLAALQLARDGKREFSEWDLTVAAWNRDRNRFGLRGFEDRHPDHKRVMTEIMGQSKKDNPVRRRFIEKVRKNCYRLTDLGEAEALHLGDEEPGSPSVRSPGPVYDAIKKYADSPPFRAWLSSPEEPRTWLGVSAFLGLGRNDPHEINDRLRAVQTAVRQATEWCRSAGRDFITRGPDGGGRPIPAGEIHRIPEFLECVKQRFARQFAAIQSRDRD